MSPALRHPNGPAFDTNALQNFPCTRTVGRLCQAAPYFALRATKGKREAEGKGAAHWPGLWQERQTAADSSHFLRRKDV
jgi:hypothetical protein